MTLMVNNVEYSIVPLYKLCTLKDLVAFCPKCEIKNMLTSMLQKMDTINMCGVYMIYYHQNLYVLKEISLSLKYGHPS